MTWNAGGGVGGACVGGQWWGAQTGRASPAPQARTGTGSAP